MERNPQSSASDLLTVLREALVSGTNPPEAIFRAIADAARALTGASGTAIALLTEDVVLCRARSGDIAPELGSALNVGSGISGECFRTSTVLRCDDTETDSRVEPEVCRILGIRSIAAVPLCGSAGPIGILEAFSSEAHAFGDEQINSLKNLGEIAESAYQRQTSVSNMSPAVPVLTFAAPGLPMAGATPHEQITLAIFDEAPAKTRHHYWILSGSLALLLVASAVVYWTWREPATESSPSQPAAQARAPETAEAAAPRGLPLKPSPTIATQLDKPRAKNVLQNAAKVESAEDANAARPRNSAAPANGAAKKISLPASSVASTPTSVDAPSQADPPTVVLATTNDGDKLSNLSSETAPLPTPDIRVSEGVKDGDLIRKVEPVYPQEAFTRHLGGSVTLEASIAEDGTVREVKVVQGDPVLAAAAVAAIQQWRYSPLLLNGKPIPIQKEITVIFKAP